MVEEVKKDKTMFSRREKMMKWRESTRSIFGM